VQIGEGTVPTPETEQASVMASASYLQILKSSALIGGSTLVNVVVGIVRIKVLAMLLGPAGVGLMGAYTSVIDMMRTVAELGIPRSGVRQIAEAVGTGDATKIATTVTVLRWIALALGILGALLVVLLSEPLAQLTFGSTMGYRWGVALVSLAVLLGIVAGGQTALLQGTRRIVELAKMNVVGSVLGTLTTIPIVYLFRKDGVAAALVALAAISVVTSWWYTRQIKVDIARLPFSVLRAESIALLKLGLAFMTSGVLMMAAAYAVRLIVIRQLGLGAAGLYQAAWALSGLYVGFILQAMGTDFYPRLVATIDDHGGCNRLVNEQTSVSLLLAGPGVIATLLFAPLALELFYTVEFVNATEMLRWFCLGVALRLVSWPMGYLIVAKNAQALLIVTELAWVIFNVGSTYVFIELWGLAGIGLAYLTSYAFHVLLIYPIVRRMTGFSWTSANRRDLFLFTCFCAAVACAFEWLPPIIAYSFGIAVLLASAAYTVTRLIRLVPSARLPRRMRLLTSLFAGLPGS
jgi:enterobacterial common antigen flippase